MHGGLSPGAPKGNKNALKHGRYTAGDARFDAFGRERFQDRIAAMPVNYVDVSSGFYNIDKHLIYPARPDTLLARRSESLGLADRHPDGQFILSGRALHESEESLPANVRGIKTITGSPSLPLLGPGDELVSWRTSRDV
jgi:hypothetical protein